MKEKTAIPYISILQIIGPILVILGHSINGLPCDGLWYAFSKEWIYIFHIPLFFLISGYLLSYNGWLRNRSYGAFIGKKTLRLLLPYVVWNLVFLVPKILAASVITDAAPTDLMGLLKAFIYPRQNVLGHTWFLLGLFEVFLIAPVLKKLLTGKLWGKVVTVIAAAVLYVLPLNSELFAISDLHKDLLFFVLGCLLGQIPGERFVALMGKWKWPAVAGAVVTSVAALIWWDATVTVRFIPCGFILLAMLSLAAQVKQLPEKLQRIGADSFAIYIMHWPVMLVVRVAVYQILGMPVAVTAALMSVLGWVIPVFVIWLVRKIPAKWIQKSAKYLLGA